MAAQPEQLWLAGPSNHGSSLSLGSETFEKKQKAPVLNGPDCQSDWKYFSGVKILDLKLKKCSVY